jgi:hypothetical protein
VEETTHRLEMLSKTLHVERRSAPFEPPSPSNPTLSFAEIRQIIRPSTMPSSDLPRRSILSLAQSRRRTRTRIRLSSKEVVEERLSRAGLAGDAVKRTVSVERDLLLLGGKARGSSVVLPAGGLFGVVGAVSCGCC